MNKEEGEYTGKTDLSYEETKELIANKKDDDVLTFHLSNQKNNNALNLDEPNSKGDLEEELCGP